MGRREKDLNGKRGNRGKEREEGRRETGSRRRRREGGKRIENRCARRGTCFHPGPDVCQDACRFPSQPRIGFVHRTLRCTYDSQFHCTRLSPALPHSRTVCQFRDPACRFASCPAPPRSTVRPRHSLHCAPRAPPSFTTHSIPFRRLPLTPHPASHHTPIPPPAPPPLPQVNCLLKTLCWSTYSEKISTRRGAHLWLG